MPRAITPSIEQILRGRYPTTETASPHIVTRVDFYDHKDQQHLLTTSPQGSAPRVKLVDWSLNTSEATDIAGTGSLEIFADHETKEAVIPLVEQAPLSPVAPTRVHIRFHADGEEDHYCQFGVYEIKDANIEETAGGVRMSVEIADNSRRVQRARFYRFDAVFPKTTYSIGFHHLLDNVLPQSEITVAPTTARTGLLTFDVQADRLSAVKEMATAIGFRIDWNFNGLGDTMIAPDVDALDASHLRPVWEFVDGGNAIATRLQRGLTDERAYNGVIAMGESTGSDKPPVRAEAWDLDPSSPTYFDPRLPEESPYGPVPFFYVSEFITTKAQARQAAQARLPKVKGLVEVLELESVLHPGIIPGDPILVERPAIGVTGIYIVESHDMRPHLSRIVCRDRRLSRQ